MAPTRYSDEDNLQLLREIDVWFHSPRGCNGAQKLSCSSCCALEAEFPSRKQYHEGSGP